MLEFWQTHGYAWIILPLLIFCARILDVTVATLRLMFLARGAKTPTVITGFFEALIWIIIISQVIRNLDNVMSYVAYAGGFAAGSYIGMRIEERLALGKVVLRVILRKPGDVVVNALREQHHSLTCVDAEGARGPVQILFMVLKRSEIKAVLALIKQYNPNAFYTIEDVRYVSDRVTPEAAATPLSGWALGRWRLRFK